MGKKSLEDPIILYQYFSFYEMHRNVHNVSETYLSWVEMCMLTKAWMLTQWRGKPSSWIDIYKKEI